MQLGFVSEAGHGKQGTGLTVGELAGGVYGAVHRRERKIFNKALDELIAEGKVKRVFTNSTFYYKKTSLLDVLADI